MNQPQTNTMNTMNNTSNNRNQEETRQPQPAPAGPQYPYPPVGLPGTPAEPMLPADALPPLTDADGAFAPEWYKRYAELGPYAATLSKFRRPEALAKSYANLERLKGYPGTEDAARMAAFRTAMGLPATAEEFAITRPEGTPDEIWDDRLAATLAKVAYDYGVPPTAMEALTRCFTNESNHMLRSCQEAEQQAIRAAEDTLQQEWGRDFERNMGVVADFLHHMGNRTGIDVQHLLENTTLQADPDFARLMLATAALTQEPPLRTGTATNHKTEARRIAHDPSHPLHEAYMRTNHPQHRYANEEYDRLAFGRPL